MSTAPHEFSDLDRTVVSPDGTTYEIVAQVGCGAGGWAMFWRRGKEQRLPIVTVYAGGQQVHHEPAADRKDAERIVMGSERQIRSGSL